MDDCVGFDDLIQTVFESSKNIATKGELQEQTSLAIRNFRLSDKDNSNSISFDEVLVLCSHMGLPLEGDEEETLLKLDTDGSGCLEMEEWVGWWLKRICCLPNPLAQQEALARNAFHKFDKDFSGAIDVNELNELFHSLGVSFSEMEMNEALAALDRDGSNLIEIEEFVDWWTNRASSKRKIGGLIELKLKKIAAKASKIYSSDIFSAVWDHDVDLVRAFLQSDPRFANSSDKSEYGAGWTPLHYASYQGFDDLVEMLISAGAKVNSQNDCGFSPLFYAAQQEHVEICTVLLSSGADPTISGAYEHIVSSPGGPVKETRRLCAVDVGKFNDAISGMLRKHSKCRPPNALRVEGVSVVIAKSGVLSFELPPQRQPGTLPIRALRLDLHVLPAGGHEEKSSGDSKESTNTPAPFSFTLPVANQNETQQMAVKLQKAWLKNVVHLGSSVVVACSISAVDAFGDIGEKSGNLIVDCSQVGFSDEQPESANKLTETEVEKAEKAISEDEVAQLDQLQVGELDV